MSRSRPAPAWCSWITSKRPDWPLVKLNYYKVSGPSPAPVPTSTSWHADYFNNNALAGSPVLVGTSSDLNFNWGLGGPGGSVPTDNWSARFTQARSFVGGTYRFVVQVDDGVRVYVDDTLVINEWREQSYRTFTGDIVISPGDHTIRVEYLEVGNAAALRMYMEKR